MPVCNLPGITVKSGIDVAKNATLVLDPITLVLSLSLTPSLSLTFSFFLSVSLHLCILSLSLAACSFALFSSSSQIHVGPIQLCFELFLRVCVTLHLCSRQVKIMNGTIRAWNDSQLQALNPNFVFPAQPIKFVYRSDPSGQDVTMMEYLRTCYAVCDACVVWWLGGVLMPVRCSEPKLPMC